MAGTSLVVQEPVGVVAAFPAYNFAFPAVPQKVGPALIAGCTAVVKVTEPNPLATFIYGDICEEVGLPPGVINIVAAAAPESEYLVRHPGVDMVSFTGSVQTGARIAAACGELIRPCVLELGGKSAAIVLEDARLEDVLPVLIGASVGTQRRAELRRADPVRRAGRAVRRVRRGARRGLQVAEDRRPDGGRHGHQPAGDRASA